MPHFFCLLHCHFSLFSSHFSDHLSLSINSFYISMEFWGVEVKAGETVKAEPADESLIHLSHVALGEIKKDKGNELVTLFMKIGEQKMVLGHLSTQNNQQITFDLVFDKEVDLSHNWKNGSVYFMGYETEVQGEFNSDDSDAEQQIGFANAKNESQLVEEVKAAAAAAPPKSNVVKPDSSSKQKAKSVQIKEDKVEDESDEDESDEDDDDDESDDGSEEGMSIDEDSDDDDDEDESESEDEETPKKAGKANKRPNDSATKTPVPAKKQKAATPQKTDAKKGGHTATPHPAKVAAKTPANGTNTKSQTPKTGGKFSCGSCDRSFGSDAALQSHSKAKHGAK